MGNKHPKGKKKEGAPGNNKEEGANRNEAQGDEEATPYFTLEVIFEMKSGSTTKPEEHSVDPNLTLSEWKEDLKQSRGIQKHVAVRRDNRPDDLGPDHLTLEALNINNRDVLLFRECG